MTPAQFDIARRLVAAGIVVRRDGDDGWTMSLGGRGCFRRASDGVLFVRDGKQWVPDLSRPTAGENLLDLLIDRASSLDVGYSGDGWWVRAWTGADWGPTCSGSTLAVVAASALLEVRRG